MSDHRIEVRWGGLLLAGAVALSGCDSGTPSARSCATKAPLPDGGIMAVDTSQTPRANRMAEILAVEASGEFVAPDAVYERVVSDLGVLRSQWPGKTAGIVDCGSSQVIIHMTDAGRGQVADGQYTAWDDYNQALHATTRPFSSGAVASFAGVYNYATLAQAYAQLPEVTGVEPDALIGASSDSCLERLQDSAGTHVYIFWRGDGDCPAGCIDHTYHGFTTTAAGGTTYLGSHDGRSGAPDWFRLARSCRNFLYPQP